jgi:hypothetical protein
VGAPLDRGLRPHVAVFVILIAYNLATEGGHIAQVAARGTPESCSAAIFAEPGLRITGPGKAQVAIVAQAFSFVPEGHPRARSTPR